MSQSSTKSLLKKTLKTLTISITLIFSNLAFADKPPFPEISLPDKAQGQRAIQLLANRLPSVAAWYGMTTEEFAKIIRTDTTAWLDNKGRLFYVEDEVTDTSASPQTQAASVPYSQTFTLHSKPGSKRVIYLDFTGYVANGTAWAGGAEIDSPPFTLDGDTTTFNNAEMDVIQEVWERVAEDYAPFDVDVTTEDPGQAAIDRSDSSDQNYGSRNVITTLDSRLCNSCGGIAYVGVFDYTNNNYKPAYVFYDRLSSNAKNIAEASSHEVGHNLGLSHDGTSTTGYYTGHGSGETSWSPIMGVGYYTQLSQWSKGEYNDASQSQDDIAVIQQNGALLESDDHSNNLDINATPLISVAGDIGRSNVSATGIISQRSDVDVFSFESDAGDLLLNIDPVQVGTNLDIEASLYDALGNLIAISNPADTTNASISLTNQAAGNYYLKIDGVGKGEALVTGYNDYGSLGQFNISGSIPATSNLLAPVSIIEAIGSTTGIAPLTVNLDASSSYDNDGTIVSYNWDFNDNGATATGISTSHIFNAPGDYAVSLSVSDNDDQVGISSLTINVSNQLPIAIASSSELSGQAPISIDFSSAGSYDPDITHTLSYAWNFSDGSSSTNANPTHQYQSAGSYTAELTVTDDLGASATDSIDIVVTANPNAAPIAPSALTASLNVSGKGKNKTISVDLSWIDNSDNEDSFVLERCNETGRGKSKVCTYSDLATLSANTTSYSEPVNGGTYKYRVRAVNSFGESPSNEVKVTAK